VEAPPLQRLRRELGLDEGVAAGIARTAADAVGGPLATGQVLGGRFRVLRFLGRGGAGRAFLAHDDLLQRTVVLKEVLCDGPDEEAAVLREARLAAGLQHPNVVTLHDVLRRPGSALIVSEHVAGGSLQERLKAGPLAPAAALRIAEGVLAGVAAIHARGIVHRDLTPGNVLLQPDDVPKIADFGIARARHGGTVHLDGPDGVQGTLEFMAPEQRRGEAATPVSDLYQAGLLLRLLFGDAPPPAVAAVAARALRPSPAARWPDVGAMADALRAAAKADGRVKPGTRGRSAPR
jgi:serine/threonine protein kinase